MKLKIIFLFLIVFYTLTLTPQTLINTLRFQLTNCKTDSCKARIENLLVEELISINEVECKKLSEKLFFTIKQKDTINYLNANFNYAIFCLNSNNFKKALTILSELKLIAEKTNNKVYLARVNFGFARLSLQNNDFKTAADLSFFALKLFEELKDYKFIAKTYFQIGKINYFLKNNSKAIEFHRKSVEIANKIGDKNTILHAYTSLGNIYSDQHQNDIALEYYNRALIIRKQQEHDLEIAPILLNIGAIYSSINQFDNAKKYYEEALALSLKFEKSNNVAVCFTNIGNIAFNLNNFKEAEENYTKALLYVDKNDLLTKEILFYNLSEANHKLGNFDNAFKYQDSCLEIKDSIYSRESIKSLNDMQTKYETTKTKLELEKKQLEANNKQLVIYAAFGGCVLLLGCLFFIFIGLTKQKQANTLLGEKNNIIEEKNKLVEAQHKDITDSIKYAERIQAAILPPDKLVKSTLPDSFIYFKPKDILSGDFYWLEETQTHIFIAAADCTGHGVPGALISMINYNLLNKAVLEQNLNDPADILNAVNIWLTEVLHQSYNEDIVNDGMDITLLSINKKTKEIVFAGAMNSIYVVSENVLSEFNGNKFPVGAFIEDQPQNFTSRKIVVKENDIVYLYTDGYADQFGGPKGKKLKSKALKQILINASSLTMDEQKEKVSAAFLEWKGNYEQVDDVCLIGIKV